MEKLTRRIHRMHYYLASIEMVNLHLLLTAKQQLGSVFHDITFSDC